MPGISYQPIKVKDATGRQNTQASPQGHFALQNGLIRHKGRILVGNNPKLIEEILQAMHSSSIGDHSGFHASYHRVKHLFSWPGLKKHVRQFVAQCSICQQAKSECVAYPGLLETLKTPRKAWQVITMDFINGLPNSSSFDCIMVIVDKFSRYSHFFPLKHPFTTFSVAMAYVKEIYRLHSLPLAIVSDRDPVFTSSLWQELHRL